MDDNADDNAGDSAEGTAGGPDDQVTERERQLEPGGLWEAPTDPPEGLGAAEDDHSDAVTDRDRMLESGGFWEAPVDPGETPST